MSTGKQDLILVYLNFIICGGYESFCLMSCEIVMIARKGPRQ